MQRAWNAIPAIFLDFTADATVLGGSLAFNAPTTVVRMIGEYHLTPTAAPTATDECILAVGIGIVSSDAFAAGAGSVPDPSGESEYPWLYWASHPFFFAGTGTTGAGFNFRHRFDIKSMRKVKPRESLAMIWQYVDNAGTPAMTAAIGETRCLLLT